MEDLFEELRSGPLAGLRVEMVHGQLPSEEKDAVMGRFAAGETDVLVATTVVEVGVDVPNASVMVIHDADRFGISQLHQLRGRIGRGAYPGVCLLLTTASEQSSARQRLDAVAATRDGFALAEVDLEQRREGDVLGASQSGSRSSLKLLRVLRDADLIAQARTSGGAVHCPGSRAERSGVGRHRDSTWRWMRQGTGWSALESGSLPGLGADNGSAMPPGDHARPTTDRVREALFSAITAWAGQSSGARRAFTGRPGLLRLVCGLGCCRVGGGQPRRDSSSADRARPSYGPALQTQRRSPRVWLSMSSFHRSSRCFEEASSSPFRHCLRRPAVRVGHRHRQRPDRAARRQRLGRPRLTDRGRAIPPHTAADLAGFRCKTLDRAYGETILCFAELNQEYDRPAEEEP